MRTVLTYGTYDILHYGHIRLLKRALALGDRLVVGLSTDEFNAQKDKKAFFTYDERKEVLESIGLVSEVFPENCWEQKSDDVKRLGAAVLVMGDDWKGHFDHLEELCEVAYFPYTNGVSSTRIREYFGEWAPHTDAE